MKNLLQELMVQENTITGRWLQIPGLIFLSPGKNPKTNLQFLTFLVNVIKAVNDSNDVLRASVMNESNSYRLGGHEAPPAIISVFRRHLSYKYA